MTDISNPSSNRTLQQQATLTPCLLVTLWHLRHLQHQQYW